MWACGRCGERNSDLVSACGICAGVRAGRPADLACESCGARVEAGVRRCVECERSLAEAAGPPPPGPRAPVWSGADPLAAELLRVELRRAGIESVLVNDWGVHYGAGLGTSTLSVAASDAARALDVLRAAREAPPAERYIPSVAMVSFACACGKTLEVPPDFQGLEMDCPFCGRALRAG